MWIGRKLALEESVQVIEGVLLPHAALQEQEQAQSLMEQAMRKSEALLEQARQQVEQMLAEAQADAERLAIRRCEEAERDFWLRAESFFSEWQAERDAQSADIISQAQTLISAVFEQLFGGLSEQQKLTALLTQLLGSGARATDVTLYHPPQYEAPLASWLAARPQLGWTRCADDGLAAETLLLQTAQGEFSISWASLQQHLLRLAS
ncbi:HrpE/YscL family type III secretion apparatus protein [Enterobacter sp. Cy-643]|uniref:type III secretion system stator protein SctL n=1 Tax=Enterobacter sp. Cy-643 TaxID=2608346 RepID=UPI00141FAB5F|nr:type III secretion system stator protein SctL [Enterobacter sp. Cy-643]NIF32633.1 HrpE/YscL family type III secretion apparatus protein [Enterobacter sp. Cy-643]